MPLLGGKYVCFVEYKDISLSLNFKLFAANHVTIEVYINGKDKQKLIENRKKSNPRMQVDEN